MSTSSAAGNASPHANTTVWLPRWLTNRPHSGMEAIAPTTNPASTPLSCPVLSANFCWNEGISAAQVPNVVPSTRNRMEIAQRARATWLPGGSGPARGQEKTKRPVETSP